MEQRHPSPEAGDTAQDCAHLRDAGRGASMIAVLYCTEKNSYCHRWDFLFAKLNIPQ